MNTNIESSLPSSDAGISVTPWTQLLLEINGRSITADCELDDETGELTLDAMYYESDVPPLSDSAERRRRIAAWVAQGNKARACGDASVPRHPERRDHVTKSPMTVPLPTRPDFLSLKPLQPSVGRLTCRPMFTAVVLRDDGSKEEVLFTPTDEEYEYMDLNFSTHLLQRFREVAAARPLRSIREAVLTEGHWMSGWWYQVVHDIPRSCETLMDLLDTCHPPRGRRMH